MLAPKVAARPLQWRARGIDDHIRCHVPIYTKDEPRTRATLFVQAHRVRNPLKASISIILSKERILGLDIEPQRSHRNLLTKKCVSETHWQCWPLMEAEADPRTLEYKDWLLEFLNRAKVEYPFPIIAPYRGIQLRLKGL